MKKFYLNPLASLYCVADFYSAAGLHDMSPFLALANASRKSTFDVTRVYEFLDRCSTFKRRVRYLRPYGQREFFMFDERRGSFSYSEDVTWLFLADMISSFFFAPYRDGRVYDFLTEDTPVLSVESSVQLEKPYHYVRDIPQNVTRTLSLINELYTLLGDVTRPFDQTVFEKAKAVVKSVVSAKTLDESPWWPIPTDQKVFPTPLTEQEFLVGSYSALMYRLVRFLHPSEASKQGAYEVKVSTTRQVALPVFLQQLSDPYAHLLELVEATVSSTWFGRLVEKLEISGKEIFELNPKTGLLGLNPRLPYQFLNSAAEQTFKLYVEDMKTLNKVESRRGDIENLLRDAIILSSLTDYSVPERYLKLFNAITPLQRAEKKVLPVDLTQLKENVALWSPILDPCVDQLVSVIDEWYSTVPTFPKGVTLYNTKQDGRDCYYRLSLTRPVCKTFQMLKTVKNAKTQVARAESLSITPERTAQPPVLRYSEIKKSCLDDKVAPVSSRWKIPFTGSPSNLIDLASVGGWVYSVDAKLPMSKEVTILLSQKLVTILPPKYGEDIPSFYDSTGRRRQNEEVSFSYELIPDVRAADIVDLLFAFPLSEVQSMSGDELKKTYLGRLERVSGNYEIRKTVRFLPVEKKRVLTANFLYYYNAILGPVAEHTVMGDDFVSINPYYFKSASASQPTDERNEDHWTSLSSSRWTKIFAPEPLTKLSDVSVKNGFDLQPLCKPLPMYVDIARYFDAEFILPGAMLSNAALSRMLVGGKTIHSLRGPIEKDGQESWVIEPTNAGSTQVTSLRESPTYFFVEGDSNVVIHVGDSSSNESLINAIRADKTLGDVYSYSGYVSTDSDNGQFSKRDLVIWFAPSLQRVNDLAELVEGPLYSSGEFTPRGVKLTTTGEPNLKLRPSKFTYNRKTFTDVFGVKVNTKRIDSPQRDTGDGQFFKLKLHLDLFRVANFGDRSVTRVSGGDQYEFKTLRVMLKYDYPEIMSAHLGGSEVHLTSGVSSSPSFRFFRDVSFIHPGSEEEASTEGYLLKYALYLLLALYHKTTSATRPIGELKLDCQILSKELTIIASYFNRFYDCADVRVAEAGGYSAEPLEKVTFPLFQIAQIVGNGSLDSSMADVQALIYTAVKAISGVEAVRLTQLHIIGLPLLSTNIAGVAEDIISQNESFFKLPTVLDSVSRFDLSSELGSDFDQELKAAVATAIQTRALSCID